jgi:redox-sensitive bicupin YhaK (pirin superfamily)
MISIRRSEERGHFDHGWLDTRHTFSFGEYHDPAFMGFRQLRVLNEDRVRPGYGFPTHGHRDMEIISYVLSGALEHKDSLGTGSVIRPGELQRMSAGTGVRHSEFNPSASEPLHFLQIWLLPERPGLPPSYEQKSFPEEERRGRARLIASPDGCDGSVTIHQDAEVRAALLGPKDRLTQPLRPGRHAWVQVARGSLEVNGQAMRAGDGAAVSGEKSVEIAGGEAAEVLLFDLA